MPPPYIIDASIWINVWRTHPPDIYVNVWQRLDGAIGNGALLSPETDRPAATVDRRRPRDLVVDAVLDAGQPLT